MTLKVVGKILSGVLLFLSFQASALKLLPLNLQEMTNQSQDIVAGVVQSVEDGFDETGIPYTQVSIKVGNVAKGKNKDAEIYTFRQFGLMKPRKLPSGNIYYGVSPEHFPTWSKDEHVVLFMFKPASKTGLQAPVGLAQGKFNVVNGIVSNNVTTKELFENVELPASLTSAERDVVKHPQNMSSDDFFSLVEKLVNNAEAR